MATGLARSDPADYAKCSEAEVSSHSSLTRTGTRNGILEKMQGFYKALVMCMVVYM